MKGVHPTVCTVVGLSVILRYISCSVRDGENKFASLCPLGSKGLGAKLKMSLRVPITIFKNN